jgi:hypothetical protein
MLHFNGSSVRHKIESVTFLLAPIERDGARMWERFLIQDCGWIVDLSLSGLGLWTAKGWVLSHEAAAAGPISDTVRLGHGEQTQVGSNVVRTSGDGLQGWVLGLWSADLSFTTRNGTCKTPFKWKWHISFTFKIHHCASKKIIYPDFHSTYNAVTRRKKSGTQAKTNNQMKCLFFQFLCTMCSKWKHTGLTTSVRLSVGIIQV